MRSFATWNCVTVGYSHEVDRTVLHRGEERTVSIIVKYPPDTQACIFVRNAGN
jgi:hypothetical protein